MTTTTSKTFGVNELSSAVYGATLEDENGAAITGPNLLSLALTVYDEKTETIINSRSSQDVLNTNGVTISSLGVLTWDMESGDNTIVTRKAAKRDNVERHVADFHWALAESEGTHRVFIDVQQVYPQ